MKPNFICVGFPKCGTTTLQEVLKYHKDIYLPDVKEAGYFVDAVEYKRGISWYETRYFSKTKKQKIIGEINGGLVGGFYARNIYKDLGSDLKIIFLMRNPVERLYSHFKFKERIGYRMIRNENTIMTESEKFTCFIKENMKFSKKYNKWDIVISKDRYIIEQGNYSEYIEEYLKYFKPENLHFIIFEEYIKNPRKSYKELFEFLDIELLKEINYEIKANEGKRQPRNEICMLMNEMCTELWREHLRNDSLNAIKTDNILLKLRDFMWDVFSKPVEIKSKLDDSVKEILQNYYREDIKKLEKIIGKELGELWYK